MTTPGQGQGLQPRGPDHGHQVAEGQVGEGLIPTYRTETYKEDICFSNNIVTVLAGADTGIHSGGCEILKREYNTKRRKKGNFLFKLSYSNKV